MGSGMTGQENADRPGGIDRLARLEAYEEIRQLAARYALALDSRDVPTLASLFVDDVQTGDGGVGHEALAKWFDPVLRPYGITFHLIGNHIIDRCHLLCPGIVSFVSYPFFYSIPVFNTGIIVIIHAR
jgi:hypothetical protein